MITIETVIAEMLLRLPELREVDRFDVLGDDPPLTYPIFETLLVPFLEDALVRGDLAKIVRVAAFLEEVSEAATKDSDLSNLIGIAIGDWLPTIEYEDRLSPWHGKETRRITGYVPGLATQRRADSLRKRNTRLASRLKRIAAQLLKKGT